MVNQPLAQAKLGKQTGKPRKNLLNLLIASLVENSDRPEQKEGGSLAPFCLHLMASLMTNQTKNCHKK